MIRIQSVNLKRSLLGTALAACAVYVLVGCANFDDEDFPQAIGIRGAVPNQVDRVGMPLVSTLFISQNRQTAYNQADPFADRQDFGGTFQTMVNTLRTGAGGVSGFPAEDNPGVDSATLAAILLPDVITLDLARPVAFPNGRRLEDDVADVQLGLLLNRGNASNGGPGFSDGVANDSAFLATFPYLGPPR